jgi:hypothetical protein
MQSDAWIKKSFNKLASGPAILFLSLLFSIFVHQQLGMDALWDTANYHVYIGWAASQLIPYEFGAVAQSHTYFNPLIDIVNYAAFSVHPYLGAAVHSLFFSIAVYLIFKIAQVFFKGESTDNLTLVLGVIISLTGAMTISLFGSWTNENINAVFVLAGLYFLLRGIGSGTLLLIFSAGLTFGFALGLKLTAAHYMVGALFATVVSTRFNLKVTLILGIGILISYLITDGYFMYMRWEKVGNPIFPFANNVFRSPFYPDIWKSFSQFDPTKTLYYLSLPVTWLSSGDFSEANIIRDGRLLLAYIGICLVVLGSAMRRKIGTMELTLIVFFLASFIAWILAFRIYRYLVVLEMLSGLLFIIGLRELTGPRKKLIASFIAIGALIFLGLVTVYPNWGRREWTDSFSKNNLTELIKEKEGSLIFFADQRLSYLAPALYEKSISFANLYSQLWWDGRRGSKGEEPDNSLDPTSIDLSKFKKIYFLQYSKLDPRANSSYLSTLFSDQYYSCQMASTNMPWNPWLCSFKGALDLPFVEPGVTYRHNSTDLLFLDGWSNEEVQHRWTEGKASSIVMKVRRTGACLLSIALEGAVLGSQNIEARVNGSVVLNGTVSGDVTLKLRGNFKVDSDSNLLKVDLLLPDARIAGNGDPRLLGFALRSLKLECAEPNASAASIP